MNTTIIRQRLHHYLDTADDRKIKALYVMVEEELKETMTIYSEELKAELDDRIANYLNGGKMTSAAEMADRLQAIRVKRK